MIDLGSKKSDNLSCLPLKIVEEKDESLSYKSISVGEVEPSVEYTQLYNVMNKKYKTRKLRILVANDESF